MLNKICGLDTSRRSITALIVLMLFPVSYGGATSEESIVRSRSLAYSTRAAYGIKTLQSWYIPASGLYEKPTDWWNAANAITVLVDYSIATHSSGYMNAVANTFERANAAYGTKNFINDSNDDEGWWALAWVGAYDATKQLRYLSMAEVIFEDMTTQWDTTTCGGGVWWSKDLKHSAYKNAVTNELFLALAAALANRVKDPGRKASYLYWAEREWRWFETSGMINSEAMINDGLDASNPAACINNKQTTWTYNQGVILGGLVELYGANNDSTLLPEAQKIANATMTHMVSTGGVLQEPRGDGPDRPQFKGVFLRNLSRLYRAAPRPEFRHFAELNADSVWDNDRAAKYRFGSNWQGPFDSGDATRQTAAIDALIAALEMQ